jgi:hypothetical protein
MYRKMFHYEINLEFFKQKKVQCYIRECHKQRTGKKKEKIEFHFHQEQKWFSNKENENDKQTVDDLHHVACFDLQAAFPTATGDISNCSYKAKIVLTMINEFCFKTAYRNCECKCAKVTSSEGECLWSFFRMCNWYKLILIVFPLPTESMTICGPH